MFKKSAPKYQLMLESELEHLIGALKITTVDDAKYAQTLTAIERLYQMMDDKKSSKVSPETRASIAANLVGILMIIKHERVNVITSKALGFVIRSRMMQNQGE